MILGDRNYEIIAEMYDFGRTGTEIESKLNEFYAQMNEIKRKQSDQVSMLTH